jgi:hypothetical protein
MVVDYLDHPEEFRGGEFDRIAALPCGPRSTN